VLVTLDAETFDYAKAEPSGLDLRVIDDDGTTILPHHIERWDPAGTSQVWVRVERIDAGSAEDHVWLYYGNDAAGDVLDPAGTYDAHHAGVWHLHETSGALVDSANDIACTWLGGGSGRQGAAGRIGGAVALDGNEDVVSCGEDRIPDTTESTITAWVRLSLTGDNHQAIVSVEHFPAPFPGLSLYISRDDGAIGTRIDNGYVYAQDPANLVAVEAWAFVAMRNHRHPTRGYVEVSRDGGAWETLVAGDTNDLRIEPGTALSFGQGAGPNEGARGLVDEISISSTVRSDAWIRAQYLSGLGSFVSIASEQSCP
jgi:biopolymer transport protein ExbB